VANPKSGKSPPVASSLRGMPRPSRAAPAKCKIKHAKINNLDGSKRLLLTAIQWPDLYFSFCAGAHVFP
jgi:hypothetical protein